MRDQGVSKRSLVVLGALAALASNRRVREAVLDKGLTLWDQVQAGYGDQVKPALGTAAQQARQLISQAGHKLGDLRQDVPEQLGQRASALVDQVRDEAQGALKQAKRQYQEGYAPRMSGLLEGVKETADDRRHEAGRALRRAKRSGLARLGELGQNLSQKASDWATQIEDSLDDHRRDAQRSLTQARRDAERELRQAGKAWNPKRLERAIEKKIAPIHKQVQRELARHERQWRREEASSKAAQAAGGSAGVALVLGTGVVLLARVPQARQSLFKAAHKLNPCFGQRLSHLDQRLSSQYGKWWLPLEPGVQAPQDQKSPVVEAKPESKATGAPDPTAQVNPAAVDQGQTPKGPKPSNIQS